VSQKKKLLILFEEFDETDRMMLPAFACFPLQTTKDSTTGVQYRLPPVAFVYSTAPKREVS
jgi:hypothetical protein